MTTLVTGGTGFIGSALVRQLLDDGTEVRALVRADSDCRNLEGLDIERVRGDLSDPGTLEQALRGCTTLFHLAADYRLWALNPHVLYQVNVDGTRNLMRAALKTGIDRIIYTSSVATLGIHPDRSPADEDTPVRVEDMIGHYKRSKFLAEAEVQRLIEEEQLPAVIVNPSTPVGPRDIKPTPTGRMIRDAMEGKIPAFVDTGLNIVHVDDVATGHRLALERGEIGQRYILGGTNMSLEMILATIAQLVKRKPPRIKLPHGLILPIAHLIEAVAKRTHASEPLLTVDGVRMAKKFMYFSSAKAERELGYKPRPPEQGLAEAIQWFRQN